MKKLIIILAVLLVVAIGVVAYAGSQAGTLVNEYKPEIEKLASNALGSEVKLGDVDLNLFPSIKAEIDQVSVKRKASDSKGLSLENLLLGIDLFPLLTGKLNISTVSLKSPSLTVIKDANGVYLEGLPPAAPKASKANAKKKDKKANTDTDATAEPAVISSPLAISVEKIIISGANLLFDDRVAKKSYKVESVNLSTGVNLSGDSVELKGIDVDGSLLGKATFSVSSDAVTLNQSTGMLNAPRLSLQVADSKFNAAANVNTKTFVGDIKLNDTKVVIAGLVPLMSEFAPIVGEYKPEGSVSPTADIKLSSLTTFNINSNVNLSDLGALVGGLGVTDGNGNAKINGNEKSQRVELPDFEIKINGQPVKLNLNAQLSPQKAQLDSLTINAFEGKIDADGNLGLGKNMPINSKFQVAGLQIEPALKTVAPNAGIFLLGTVENLSGNLSGGLGGDRPLAGLQANTALKVVDGKLVGTNIMGKVLQALVSLPLISEGLSSKLPPEARDDLNSDDTLIKSLTASFKLSGEKLSTKDLELVSGAFRLTSQGTVGLDSSIDLRSQFRFTPAVSQAIAAAVKEMEKLIDENGEMIIPLQLSGKGSSMIVLPDLEEITKTIAKGVVREKATELISEGLGKLFGR